MTVVVVGYIKDFKVPEKFKNNAVKIIEGISERIDYIRANNLEQKESFTLIPKFVTNIVETGKQIAIFIQKIDILSNLRKKRVAQFGKAQTSPFFDSRQILVTVQKLKDLFPINVLIINWGSVRDTIGYLQSAEAQIYNIKTILIKRNILSDDLENFLNDHHFRLEQNEHDLDYYEFNNKKPNIKTLIFKEPSDILDYINLNLDDSDADIFAINWGIQMYLPFDKFFPCKDSTIYFDRKSHSERIKDAVLFGNTHTMIRLAKIYKEKRIIFLDSLRSEGFHFTSFN